MAAIVNCISGPVLVFFDHTYDGTPTPEEKIADVIHKTTTHIFVISQAIYVFSWISIFNKNMDKFKGFENHIYALNFFRTTLILFVMWVVYCEK